MKLRTSILIGIAITVSIFIFLNSYSTYLSNSWSEDPLTDSILASLPKIGGLIGAIIAINQGLKWGEGRRKNIQQEEPALDGKYEKSLLSLQGSEGKMDYDLYFTEKSLVMVSQNNQKNNRTVNYEDLKFIHVRRGSGGNLSFESTIIGWRILWLNKAQLEQLSAVLPTIPALGGKLEIK
jgi:hypothetical protein